MSTRQTFVEKVNARTTGAQKVSGVAAIGTFVDMCLPTLNAAAITRGRERLVELTITGDSGDEYSLGSDWTDDFSSVREVWVWETNDTDEHPLILNNDEWTVEERLPAAGGSQIRFHTYTGGTADRYVVVHTALHTMTDAASTLDARDEEAFADLVAARVLQSAATALGGMIPQDTDSDGLLGSPQEGRIRTYRDSARELENRYRDHFGIGKEDGAVVSSAFVATASVDKVPSSLHYRHTHRSRRRGY